MLPEGHRLALSEPVSKTVPLSFQTHATCSCYFCHRTSSRSVIKPTHLYENSPYRVALSKAQILLINHASQRFFRGNRSLDDDGRRKEGSWMLRRPSTIVSKSIDHIWLDLSAQIHHGRSCSVSILPPRFFLLFPSPSPISSPTVLTEQRVQTTKGDTLDHTKPVMDKQFNGVVHTKLWPSKGDTRASNIFVCTNPNEPRLQDLPSFNTLSSLAFEPPPSQMKRSRCNQHQHSECQGRENVSGNSAARSRKRASTTLAMRKQKCQLILLRQKKLPEQNTHV